LTLAVEITPVTFALGTVLITAGAVVSVGGDSGSTTNRGGRPQRYSYYRCQIKFRDYNDACTNKSHRAEKVESRVWESVSDLLKDPDRLRGG
jgi:hypothetical protein